MSLECWMRVGQPLEPTLELPVQLTRAIRECSFRSLGEKDREGVRLALSRRPDLDCKLIHRGAMVSEVQGSGSVWC